MSSIATNSMTKSFADAANIFSTPLFVKAVLTDQPPSPLRELRLEVTPAMVRSFCEEAGKLQPVGQPQSAEALALDIDVRTAGEHYKIRPAFSPRASIGLFVLRGEADFDDITLERLDP